MRTSFEMSERKVLSKYYPPDFDSSKLVQNNGAKKGPKQQTVRLMAPFTMRCNTCGEYIYRRKKFNARKENPQEKYLSTKLFRFRIRCTRCRAEITFKTDPKNKDYTAERGAKRNFEPWREEKSEEAEEEDNRMEELEKKQMDSKREMELMDALDEVRASNARIDKLSRELNPDAILKLLNEQPVSEMEEVEKLEKEDAELAKQVFGGVNGKMVRRISEGMGENIPPVSLLKSPTPVHAFAKPTVRKRKEDAMNAFGIVKKKTKLI